jgi:hypothetical protein
MPIFYNEQIFDSGEDYQIGGFYTDKKENITYADIFSAFVDRISNYIDEYVKIAVESYAVQGYENPDNEAMNALYLVTQDYLEVPEAGIRIELEYISKETILKAIVDCDQSQKWLTKIDEKVKNYPKDVIAEQYGIKNFSETKSKLHKEAKEIMEDSSLESILERLSTIDL